MTDQVERIYTGGDFSDAVKSKLRDLTRDTKKEHAVFDLRHPAWGLGALSFTPIPESGSIIARAEITVPPGDVPKNGDVLLVPTKDYNKPTSALIFDVERMPGDYIGDGYAVHVVQYNAKEAVGHEFVAKGQAAGRS